MPTPVPSPIPTDPQQFGAYLTGLQAQGQDYKDRTARQFEVYRQASEAQGADYAQARQTQGDQYAAARQAQGDQYSADMRAYSNTRANWQESREKAIGSAEGRLEAIYDNYSQAFRGSLAERWDALLAIMAGLLVVVLIFQKRKDVV